MFLFHNDNKVDELYFTNRLEIDKYFVDGSNVENLSVTNEENLSTSNVENLSTSFTISTAIGNRPKNKKNN